VTDQPPPAPSTRRGTSTPRGTPTRPVPPTPARGPRAGAVAGVVLLALLAALAVVAVGLSRGGGPGGAVPGDTDGGAPDTAVVDTPHLGRSAPDGAGYAVWDRNDDGLPIRWDPCSDVEVVVSPAGAPEGARDDLDEAIARLAARTGLSIRVVGDTEERPAADRSAFQPERYGDGRWAPVLVAWAEPHERGVPLRDIDRGLAVPVAVGAPGARVFVTGQVVLNVGRDDLRPGFDDRADSWGATLLHELAHLVGLAHVDDPDELMSVHPGTGPIAFGPGDRAGLAAVGAEHGCLVVPEPRHVDVAGPRD